VQTSSSAPDPARIQTLALFASLSAEECAELASRAQERDFDAGQTLLRQGDGGYTFGVIESGTADVLVDDARVRSLGPGDVIGELAVLGGGYRTATVVATTPVGLLAFFGLEFHELEQKHPELTQKIRQAMADRQA
jgi:CRP/FNR family cyclic AMP-dependent transcriptional regulator